MSRVKNLSYHSLVTSSDGIILKTWLSQLRWNCRGQRVVCDARVGMAAHHEQVIRRWFTNRWIMILLDGVQDDNDEVKIVRMMSTMAE